MSPHMLMTVSANDKINGVLPQLMVLFSGSPVIGWFDSRRYQASTGFTTTYLLDGAGESPAMDSEAVRRHGRSFPYQEAQPESARCQPSAPARSE